MIGKQKHVRLPAVSFLLISLTLAALFTSTPQGPALAQSAGNPIHIRIAAEESPYANVLLDMSPVKFPVKPYVEDGTTMVPLRALGEAVGAKIGWDEANRAATYSKGGLTLIITIGKPTITASDGRPVSMPEPATLLDGNTMVPVRLFTEILGYQVSWDEHTRTVHILSPEEHMRLWGFYALGSISYSSWQDVFGAKYPLSADDCPAQKMDGVFLGWFSIGKHGKITSEHNSTGFQKPDGWPSVILEARWHGMKVFSMYFADEQSDISSLLEDPTVRRNLARDIAATSAEYDGVLIDFEGLGLDEATADRDRQNFSEFLTALRSLLKDKPLSVALPPLDSPFAGYDHEYIGNVADFIVLMAYNYQERNNPSPVAPFEQVDKAIRQEIEIMGPEKVILGVPAYGALYTVAEDGQASIRALPPSKDGLTGLPEYPNAPGLDADPQARNAFPVFVPEYLCKYVEWEGQDASYKAYLEDALSLKTRVLMAKRYGLKGVAVWRLGLLPENWWP